MSEGASTLAPGAVFGRYVLVEAIGRGAMGEVWGAIDPDLDRKIALKLLRSDRTVRPEDRARLAAEARAMARLTHPNVVAIHDVGELGDQLFIAMEFVAGETLDHFIARGPHAYEEVLTIMRQAAAGLAAAHSVGLVHRDFKPANVMIGEDGRVRVLDFGLARPDSSVADDEGEQPDRKHRRIHGSPAYMAPEQHRGLPVDARSDLFSFCVSLFEALYGVRPFRGNNRLTVALAIIEGRVVDPPADALARVPEWIRGIVLRGLARDPAQRFQSMDALLAALERSPERMRQRRLRIGGMCLGIVGMVGLGYVVLPEPARDPCEDAGAAIEQEWDAEVRTRVRADVDALASRPLAGRRLVEGIDAHARDWGEASVQLCRDRRARRLTERLQSTREACLAEHREALRVLVRMVGDEGQPGLLRGVAERPFAAVRALGDPSECVDRPAPVDDRPLPSEVHIADRLALRLALAVSDGPALPTDLLAHTSTEVDGDPELALLLGRLAALQGDREQAEARLHAAAAAATSSAPELAGLAWLALIELELALLEDDDAPTDISTRTAALDRTAQLIDYADALLPAHDQAARAQLGLLAGRWALLDQRADHPALLDDAIARLAEQRLRAPDLLVALLEVRAHLHERHGREADASADRTQATQVLLEAYGPAR